MPALLLIPNKRMEDIMSNSDSAGASEAWRELYHKAWLDVGKLFFYEDRLKDWSAWEHRFDDDIVDRHTARHYTIEMLSSLGDDYTRLLPDHEAQERET